MGVGNRLNSRYLQSLDTLFDMAKDGPVVVEMPVGPSAGMLNRPLCVLQYLGRRYTNRVAISGLVLP